MEDCFALNESKECTALKEKRCYKCRFYRNDIDRNDIEADIRRYCPGGKKNDYEILLRK